MHSLKSVNKENTYYLAKKKKGIANTFGISHVTFHHHIPFLYPQIKH